MKLTSKVLYINVGMSSCYKPFDLKNKLSIVESELQKNGYLIKYKTCLSHSQNGILYHKVWLDIVGSDNNGYKAFKLELKKVGYTCKLY